MNKRTMRMYDDTARRLRLCARMLSVWLLEVQEPKHIFKTEPTLPRPQADELQPIFKEVTKLLDRHGKLVLAELQELTKPKAAKSKAAKPRKGRTA